MNRLFIGPQVINKLFQDKFIEIYPEKQREFSSIFNFIISLYMSIS
jgi:hypothetical protein